MSTLFYLPSLPILMRGGCFYFKDYETVKSTLTYKSKIFVSKKKTLQNETMHLFLSARNIKCGITTRKLFDNFHCVVKNFQIKLKLQCTRMCQNRHCLTDARKRFLPKEN